MEINVAFALLLTVLAGLSTTIGSTIAFFIRRPRYTYLSFLLGFSTGVMLYISFVELLATAIGELGFMQANLAFFAGLALFALIDILVPHSYEAESAADSRLGSESTTASAKETAAKAAAAALAEASSSVGSAASAASSAAVLKRSGLVTALGIAIHNFPEGLITFSAAATGDLSLGIMIAAAVAIHNIPEGMAVAVPIFYATGSRRRAFTFSFLSGLAEPAGALIGYLVLLPFLSPVLLASTLAGVAGVMVYICLDELLPAAHRYGRAHLVILGIVAGMAIMALSLGLLG